MESEMEIGYVKLAEAELFCLNKNAMCVVGWLSSPIPKVLLVLLAILQWYPSHLCRSLGSVKHIWKPLA